MTGIDAAEKRTKNLREKDVGMEGQKYLEDLILNKELWVECGDWDKYGRLLGTLYHTEKDMKSGWEKVLMNML